MTDLHILIVGNPVDGFRYYGPFETGDDAIRKAEQSHSAEDWWIAPMTSPEDELEP